MDKSPGRFGSVSILEYMGRLFLLSTFARAGISSGPDGVVQQVVQFICTISICTIYLDSVPLGIIPLSQHRRAR
jgi:hypothetical protein